MRKFFSMIALVGLVSGLVVAPARAEVTVSAAPASLVTDPLFVKASSDPLPVFSVSLNATAGETLTSLSVLVANQASSTASGSDLANISVYKDGGNGTFEPASDLSVGQQPSVLIGASSTVVTVNASTTATGKFFVTVSTGGSWSGNVPADSIKLTLPANGIVTSAGAASTSAVTTAAITADTTGPVLTSVVAKNTGGTDAKEAGDSIELTFSEPTKKPTITTSTIGSYFSVNNGHSFLDASGSVGSILWDETGKKLTVTLSGASTSVASIALGDVVTVTNQPAFADLAGNYGSGTQSVGGSFAGTTPSDGTSDEDVKGNCANSLINGRLYKIGTSPTVYLAAACRLKPFRGEAVFKARGQKFQNIIVLASQPANITVSQNPVLPVAGTLVKGSDKTVWFVTKDGTRRGFVSGKKFLELGFAFNKVQTISNSDLALIPVSSPIEENESHPDGALIKCGASASVYQVIGKMKFPFASADAFTGKGHTFTQVLPVDCSKFQYPSGAPINQ